MTSALERECTCEDCNICVVYYRAEVERLKYENTRLEFAESSALRLAGERTDGLQRVIGEKIDLSARLQIAREALEELIDKVDESLLLDDEIAQDWDHLNSSVKTARAALERLKESK